MLKHQIAIVFTACPERTLGFFYFMSNRPCALGGGMGRTTDRRRSERSSVNFELVSFGCLLMPLCKGQAQETQGSENSYGCRHVASHSSISTTTALLGSTQPPAFFLLTMQAPQLHWPCLPELNLSVDFTIFDILHQFCHTHRLRIWKQKIVSTLHWITKHIMSLSPFVTHSEFLHNPGQ